MDPEIYRILFETLGGKSKIKLFNTYRGVPITASGQLVELHGNDATLTTTALQIVSIRFQKITYLNFGQWIFKACLANSNLNDELIKLTDFEICKKIIGKRRLIRVEPDIPIRTQVTSPRFNPTEEQWINSRMVDISLHGAAILLHSLVVNQTPLYKGDVAELKFDLVIPSIPGTFQARVKAIVRHVSPHDEKYVRIGLETKPDAMTENFITSYIAHLQKIIIQELKERVEQERPLSNF